MVAVEAAAAGAAAVEGPIRAEAKVAVAPEAEAEAEVKGDALAPGEAEEEEEEEEREYKSDMRKLEDLMSKLNPCAQEFVPSSRRPAAVAAPAAKPAGGGVLSADAPVFVSAAEYYGAAGGHLQVGGGGGSRDSSSDGSSNGSGHPLNRRRRNSFNQGRRRMGGRPRRADREDSVRRTVYVSDIDQHVTEQKLAEVFSNCGQVVDCRICGDPHSVLRFAFVEFADDAGARAALTLGGTVLGYYPVRVLPSKTAILPVNPKFLPRTEDEKEMVSRTVYCTNIDKKVTEEDVKLFFQGTCGKVSRLRLLGDYVHSTCIAFVEFAQAESAILALNFSGMVLGSLPIRVSPSKTPVRPRSPRVMSN
ncbi:Polyadenylate-binding protein-interacting protein 9 [Dichanthelium oligosanthes]|uniref:Polyadenylate-binding protein-interacting protein 9 n=1 Tax=Dichanthelium oligosanthes TaxID=888268 RepID=A0A1E5WFA3_9POAL|nr:Polyadenylate-binding protein-interacting protein 9 [Dichanthelium oligosanthes]